MSILMWEIVLMIFILLWFGDYNISGEQSIIKLYFLLVIIK